MSARNAMSSTLGFPVILLLLVGMGSGCAAVSPSVPGADLAAVSAPEAVPSHPAGAASINIEIRAAGRSPELRTLSLQNGMHVQDALEQSKLSTRFRRMDVRIMRPSGGHMAKLDVKHNSNTGRIDPLFDYALHPGDHLVVIEDTSTVLDDMLGSLSLTGTSRRK